MELGFAELWERLNDGDESHQIEAKTASELGRSVQETISAFSNEPGRGGGYLVLGVGRVDFALFPTYEVIGVPDPDTIQSELATVCRGAFSAVIRPEIVIEARAGRAVVVAFIPEAQPQDKPVYIQSKGLPHGAFRRIGPTDQHCTDDDIQLFYQQRSHKSFDESVVVDCDLSDLDSLAITEYRRSRRDGNPDAPELHYDDADLMHCLSCATRHEGQLRPTIAGLMLFGTHAALRRNFPMMRVDYIRVNGREWVKDPDERFESVEILGPLMLTIPRAIGAILDDVPMAFRLYSGENQRTEVPVIPRTAVREAVVNAVMHRSYRQKSPIQIIRYSNRIEIRNPGHSLVPDDRLGEPGSTTRNEKIAAVLHETRYAETKGSGIRSMREAMAMANLTPPTFESDRERDTFVVTFLFHHFLSSADTEWLSHFHQLGLTTDEQRALVFVREMGAINNSAYRDINRVETLSASGHLRRLRELGLLSQKGKSTQTYYIPTDLLLDPISRGSTPAISQGLTPATSQGLTEPAEHEAANANQDILQIGPLPPDVTRAIGELPVKPAPERVRAVIRQICSVRPFSANQIAFLLNRGKNYIRREYLQSMTAAGELEHTVDNPANPNLKYRIPAIRQQGPNQSDRLPRPTDRP